VKAVAEEVFYNDHPEKRRVSLTLQMRAGVFFYQFTIQAGSDEMIIMLSIYFIDLPVKNNAGFKNKTGRVTKRSRMFKEITHLFFFSCKKGILVSCGRS
jgi:hypothetical protein